MEEPGIDADAFNAFEATGWEAHAAGYEEYFGRITTRVVEPLLDAAGAGGGTRLLDVATGPGFVAAAAAARGAVTIAVDNAEAMLAIARRRHPRLDVRRGDVEALPFPDGSFDAVVAGFVMLHVGRPERVAAELARVLAPGGRLAFTVWDAPERARLLGVVVDAIAEVGAIAPPDMPAGPPVFRFADDGELSRLLAGAGLDDVRVRTIAFSHAERSADALWQGLMGGTARVSELVLRQSADVQHAIRAAFDRIVERHRAGDRLEIPVSVKLAVGRRPAGG